MYTKPTYSSITTVRQSITQYDDAISRAQNMSEKRDSLVSQRQSFSESDVDRLNTFLPDSIDSIKLIIEINNLASRYTQNVKNIRVSDNSSSSSKNTAPVSTASDTSGLSYRPVSVSFIVSLPYDQFLKFVDDLEHNLRLMDITSLTFSQSPNSPYYDYAVTLSTYVLK